ncbi:MAG: fumarate hydratase [Ignisphaera sp.]|uniref:Fumarate hydratase n=1 Tax=Ignisphaera aggregans TaxID=334771 RepID=A0A7J3MY06_9CREN
MDAKEELIDVLIEFIKIVETSLSIDVYHAIDRLIEVEEGLSREIAKAMVMNIDVARSERIPICQDTGIFVFFIKLGLKNPYIDIIGDAIINAVERATRDIPLRPNAVNPFTNINSGTNLGRYIPWIQYEIDKSDTLEVCLYVAGGGSSSVGEAKVLQPIDAEKEIEKIVLEVVLKRGINSCPPLIIGIGIGPTIEIASVLSKKALLREIGKRHEDPNVAELEQKLKEKLNSLGLGPQGLKGKTFVLDVFVEYAYRHPATYAIAVSAGCWVHRKGCIKIYPDMSFEIPTHNVIRKKLYG